MANTLITVPRTAKSGEIIEIKALVQHPMETGYRRSGDGDMLPRDLIRRFSCRFVASGKDSAGKDPGDPVFSATFYAAVAANPYLSFHLRATNSGTLLFMWEGDNRFVQRETASLVVT
jgi:sulfur-oxidizing protein SoxZ